MAVRNETSDKWRFAGFAFPTTTPVPDQLFDELLPRLSGAEVKVLLYICRRTFGFKRQSDSISLNQIANGIVTRAGRVLDSGTGLSKRHVQRALGSLEDKNIIKVARQVAEDGVNEINVYALNILENGVGTLSPYGGDKKSPRVGPESPQGRDSVTPGVETPESTTTNSKQQTDLVVVDQLTGHGISPKIARQLASEYPEPYLQEKMEIVDYLVEAESPLVSRNPAGYLRKAITEDYSPPKGFKSRAEREVEAKEQANQRVAAERRRRKQQEEQRAEQAEREALRQHILARVPKKLQDLWSQVLGELQLGLSKKTFETWCKDSVLLSVKDGVATVGVESAEAQTWLTRQVSSSVSRILTAMLGEQVVVRFDMLHSESGPRAETG